MSIPNTGWDKNGSPKVIIRYFLMKYPQYEQGEGIILLKHVGNRIIEKSWRLREIDSPKWRASNERANIIANWFFIENKLYFELSEEEAFALLPSVALSTINEPVNVNSYIIDTDTNPYEEETDFPRHMFAVSCDINLYLEKGWSPWVLTFDVTNSVNIFKETPYLQYSSDSNSPHYFEITDNNYINNPSQKISYQNLSKLFDIGWNSSDGEHPNLWIEFNKNRNLREIAEIVATSFYIAYKPSWADFIAISPHPLDAGMSFEEFAQREGERLDPYGVRGFL